MYEEKRKTRKYRLIRINSHRVPLLFAQKKYPGANSVVRCFDSRFKTRLRNLKYQPSFAAKGESREAEKPLFRCRALFDKRRNQRSLKPGNAVSQKKERGGGSPWGLGRVTEEPKNRFLL